MAGVYIQDCVRLSLCLQNLTLFFSFVFAILGGSHFDQAGSGANLLCMAPEQDPDEGNYSHDNEVGAIVYRGMSGVSRLHTRTP